MRITYPNYFRDMTREDAEELISVWLKMFDKDSFDAVNNAITSLIQNGAKFCPVIGEIKAEMGKKNPKGVWELNNRPYPQSFIDTVHKFLAEEEKAGRYKREKPA